MSAPLELQADVLQFENLASVFRCIASRLGYLALLLAEGDLHRNWPTVFRDMSLRVHLNWSIKWKQRISASCCQPPVGARSLDTTASIRQPVLDSCCKKQQSKSLGCCTCCCMHVGMKRDLNPQLCKMKSYGPHCTGAVREPQPSPSAAKPLTG